jgi:hypothetical protein
MRGGIRWRWTILFLGGFEAWSGSRNGNEEYCTGNDTWREGGRFGGITLITVWRTGAGLDGVRVRSYDIAMLLYHESSSYQRDKHISHFHRILDDLRIFEHCRSEAASIYGNSTSYLRDCL